MIYTDLRSENLEPFTSTNPRPTNDHLNMAHNVGRLEGRLDGLEGRFNHFEKRIEARLQEIEDSIKQLRDLYLQGRGMKLLVGGIVAFIILIPNLIQVITLIKSLWQP